jgi:hypothetical protein
MEIDLKLLGKIESDLRELGTIAQQEVYDPSIVLLKIKDVTSDLEQINTISKDLVRTYKKQEVLMIEDMKKKKQIMKSKHEEINKKVKLLLAEAEEVNKNKGTKPHRHKKLFDWDDAKLEEMKLAIKMDSNNIGRVLRNFNIRHFARQRKRWLWWSNKLFDYKFIILQIVKLLISVSAAFVFERLVDLFLKTPEFLITAMVAIILFFTLDKYLDRKFEKIFWTRVKKHILILYMHFDLYLQHMKIMLEN